MDRVYAAGAIETPPDPPASPSPGYPTAGNPAGAVPATKPGPWWYHQITEEIRSVILLAGIEPDHTQTDQMATAVAQMIAAAGEGLRVLSAVPAVEDAPLIYVPPYGVMAWSATHGIYRSVECGQLVIHTAPTAKPGTVKANGGVLSKAAYAGLWSQAQDDGLVVAAGNWLDGHWHYEDVDAGTFRVPDVRGEFPRFWDDGRGVDPGRVLGSWQSYEIQAHVHEQQITSSTATGTLMTGSANRSVPVPAGVSTLPTGGAETRPRNVAFTPCIHI